MKRKFRHLATAGLTGVALLMVAAGQPGTPTTQPPTTPPTATPPATPGTGQPAVPPTIRPVKPGIGAVKPLPAKPAPDAPPGAEQPPAPPPPPPRVAQTMKWNDPDLEKAGKLLAGTWKTTTPVPQGNDATAKADIVLSIAPVMIEGVPNALFCETARADSLHAPYRVSIFQFYKHKGALRLRTYEFHHAADGTAAPIGNMLAGMSAIPEWFPEFKREQLVGTLDVELKPEGDGYNGKTPYPYPTAVGTAVEMTSEMTLTKDTLVSADRGYDAEGKVVWGSQPSDKYTFKRVEPAIVSKKLEDGLVVLEFKKGGDSKAIEDKDQVTVHYSGWLAKNGKPFDSSRGRPMPFRFNQGGLIKAWNVGLLGYQKGSIIRVYVPPSMGYGDKPRGNAIPANSDLYFEVEVMGVEPPPPPPPTQPGPEGGAPIPGGAPPAGAVKPLPPPVKAEPVADPKKPDAPK
ncbi:MAG: CpcT/CpeT family chromophore lyase [Planctomycetota bacterium]